MRRLCLNAVGGHHCLQTHRFGNQHDLNDQIGSGTLRKCGCSTYVCEYSAVVIKWICFPEANHLVRCAPKYACKICGLSCSYIIHLSSPKENITNLSLIIITIRIELFRLYLCTRKIGTYKTRFSLLPTCCEGVVCSFFDLVCSFVVRWEKNNIQNMSKGAVQRNVHVRETRSQIHTHSSSGMHTFVSLVGYTSIASLMLCICVCAFVKTMYLQHSLFPVSVWLAF